MSSNMAEARARRRARGRNMIVAGGHGLGHVVGIDDVEDAVEAMQDAELVCHALCVRYASRW